MVFLSVCVLSSITSSLLIDNWLPSLMRDIFWCSCACMACRLLWQRSVWPEKAYKISWVSAIGMRVQMLWLLFICYVLCTTSSCFVVVYKSSGNVHRLHTQIALFYTLNGECKKDKSLPVKLLLLHSCFYQHGTFREMEVKVSKWESLVRFCV